MISVKICGITSPGDAEMCVKAGARALGFVFYGLSPRAISPGGAREIAVALPAGVKKVGVFVNQKKESVLDIAQRIGLDMVQLSGDELVVDCQWLTAQGVRVVKAVRPKTSRDVQKLADYKDHVFAFNVDAFKEGQFGGTGQVAEWALARQAKDFGRPVILAGGLTGGNVLAALRAVEPSALDVCSGVEKEPGHKDPKKLKGFFEALWRYDEEMRAKGATVGSGSESVRLPPGSGFSGRIDTRPASGPIRVDGSSAMNPKVKVLPPAMVPPPPPPPAPAAPLVSQSPAAKADEKPSVEDAPLVDWASASAAMKKPGDLPPGPGKK